MKQWWLDLYRRVTVRRAAEIAILVLLLALLRSLGEYFWLRHVHGPSLKIDAVTPYVTGAAIAAAGIVIASIAYFASRHRLVIAVVAATIVGLLVYKISALGFSI